MQLTATNTIHALLRCNNCTTNLLHKQINNQSQHHTQGNFYSPGPPEKDVAGPKICQWPVTLKTDYDRGANLGLVLRPSLSYSSSAGNNNNINNNNHDNYSLEHSHKEKLVPRSKSYLCSMKSKC